MYVKCFQEESEYKRGVEYRVSCVDNVNISPSLYRRKTLAKKGNKNGLEPFYNQLDLDF